MTSATRLAALLSFALLGGCATGSLDPHRPKTIEAGADGGKVSVAHGQRLHIPLGDEWRRAEPPIMAVVAQGAPQPDGIVFTPVRTGQETLKFESAQKTVSYDIEVR